MALPTLEAVYKAVVKEVSVNEKKGKPEIIVQMDLLEIYAIPKGGKEKKWMDCSPKNWSIAAYVYLTKNDGDVNATGVSQLQDGLGWNPDTGLLGLADGDFSGISCQADIREDVYEGKKSMKVKWLRKADADPDTGVPKAGRDVLDRMASSLDSRLRAFGTPTTGTASAKTEDELPF